MIDCIKGPDTEVNYRKNSVRLGQMEIGAYEGESRDEKM